jgi:hypothetical protein
MGKREGSGRKSLEETLGEPVIKFTVRITKSQHDHITSQDMPAAEYIRRLIEADIITRAELEAFKAIPRKAGETHGEGG